jgi:hypothetical protein
MFSKNILLIKNLLKGSGTSAELSYGPPRVEGKNNNELT